MFLEYVNYEPTLAAIIEYKNIHAKPFLPTNSNRRALQKLATRAELPFFIVWYSDDLSTYAVLPDNEYAVIFMKSNDAYVDGENYVSELEFVKFLYKLRGIELPDSVRVQLHSVMDEYALKELKKTTTERSNFIYE